MTPEVSFTVVKTPPEVARVAELAGIIWKEHYIPIIGKAQVDYMLEKFQSAPAIEKQLVEGICYVSIKTDGITQGYMAFERQGKTLFLSKIYLLDSFRGLGIGKVAMSFLEEKAHALGCKQIALTVNKYNNQSINAYLRLGFEKKEGKITDIGGGFVMDDYLMVKLLKNTPCDATGSSPV
ncbi:MAG: GNAT family N-acetyltransferase [Robiginitalea sp.]|uniref:GNAT family N-acetyltransferase n=1 Tax=Robiginitalea sp. TaxID=1902411 RepID=UPI003C78B1D2